MTTSKKVKTHTIYKKSDGTRVPGCTTIVGMLNKPQLLGWANNLGLEGIAMDKYVDDLANVGTLAHELVRCHFTGETPDLNEFTPNDVERAQNCMKSFNAWIKGVNIEPVLNEKQLVSDKFGFGGTFDMLAKIDGVLTVIDFKSSKAIYDDHAIQLGGYKILLREAGYNPEKAMIVRIGRANSEGFEVKEYEEKIMEVAEEMFMHLLAIYNLKREMK